MVQLTETAITKVREILDSQEPKPAGLSIVGPNRIEAADFDQYAEWLRANHCSLGLGDGAGMNICFRVRGIAPGIVRAFNSSQFHAYVEGQESA